MSAGSFATARQGIDLEFIQSRSRAGFPAPAIARMLGCSVLDVQPYMLARQAPLVVDLRPPRPEIAQGKPPTRVSRASEVVPPSARAVIAKIARRTGVSEEQLFAVNSTRLVSRARHRVYHALYEMRTIYGTRRFSFAQIGGFFHRDHTTVIHGWREHGARILKGEA